MADPTKYKPHFNYSGWEQDSPIEPKPGAELDVDFDDIARSIDETIGALKDLRRSDGKLNNAIVTFDSLNPAVKAAIAGSEFDYEVIEDLLAKDANLSDITDAAEARANLGTFNSAAEVASRHVPASITAIRTLGRFAPGDDGGAGLAEADAADPGAIPSGDGRWWAPRASDVTLTMFGGETGVNTTAAFNDFVSFLDGSGGRGRIGPGEFTVDQATGPGGASLEGAGPLQTTLRRAASGYGLDLRGKSNLSISGLTVDQNRQSIGDAGGHAIRADGSNLRFRDLVVKDFGTRTSDGAGGGSGLLVGTEGITTGVRLADSDFLPDTAAGATVGWLFTRVHTSFVHGLYTKGAVNNIGYAHELKNQCWHNNLWGLISEASNFGLAYGQEGGEGPSFNVAGGLVSKSTDVGVVAGQGEGNLFYGVLHDATDALESRPTRLFWASGSTATRNAMFASVIHGESSHDGRAFQSDGLENFAEFALYSDVPHAVHWRGSASRNVANIVHPGSHTSIFDLVRDDAGRSYEGTDGNVVYSIAAGQQLGSLSGYFHQCLTPAGALFEGSQRWRFERLGGVQFAFGSDGSAGRVSGITFTVPGDSLRAGIWHSLGNSAENDWFGIRGWGAGMSYVFSRRAFHPAASGLEFARDLGSETHFWRRAYAHEIRPGDGASGVRWFSGSGDPNGAQVGAVGSLYTRTDGAGGSTLYVKETGSDNMGWVAK